MSSAIFYPPDYLKIYEKDLKNHFNKFTSKCNNFEQNLEKAHETYQRNFNGSSSRFKDENFMRENCNKKLKEIKSFMKIREDLERIIEKEMLEDDNKPIDVELLGLSIKRQNEILADRILNFEYSKHMAKKVLSELLKELKAAEAKEIESRIEMKNQEILIKSFESHQKSIEDELNAEVERLKINFVKSYNQKLHFKRKYDKNDKKIRLELMVKESELRENLLKNKTEIEKVEKEIEEKKKILMEEENLNLEFFEKFEFLKIETEEKSHEVCEIEKKIKNLQKSIFKVEKSSNDIKNETEKTLQDVKENSLVAQRIAEIYRDEFGSKFEAIEDQTLQSFETKEKIIKKLQKNICKFADQICDSTAIINQLKDDIDFFMGRDPKFVMGVDHMGGNILSVNK